MLPPVPAARFRSPVSCLPVAAPSPAGLPRSVGLKAADGDVEFSPMHTPLPATLPDRLPAYLPGRIIVVPEDAWELHHHSVAPSGIRTSLPRYGLELRTRDVPISADRVRWLTERSTTRPLGARHVHLVHHRGELYVIDGHHALAAHLATGSERIPVKLLASTAA